MYHDVIVFIDASNSVPAMVGLYTSTGGITLAGQVVVVIHIEGCRPTTLLHVTLPGPELGTAWYALEVGGCH